LVFIVVSYLLAFPPMSYMHSSSHSCHMPCPFHPPWLHHSNYTWRRVFSNLPSLHLSLVQIFTSPPCSLEPG
jgi:hypothetical protein